MSEDKNRTAVVDGIKDFKEICEFKFDVDSLNEVWSTLKVQDFDEFLDALDAIGRLGSEDKINFQWFTDREKDLDTGEYETEESWNQHGSNKFKGDLFELFSHDFVLPELQGHLNVRDIKYSPYDEMGIDATGTTDTAIDADGTLGICTIQDKLVIEEPSIRGNKHARPRFLFGSLKSEGGDPFNTFWKANAGHHERRASKNVSMLIVTSASHISNYLKIQAKPLQDDKGQGDVNSTLKIIDYYTIDKYCNKPSIWKKWNKFIDETFAL